SHEDHIAAMIRLAVDKGCRKLALHAMLDGRDTPPRAARPTLARFNTLFSTLGYGHIASISGRFFGMDRDKRWERVAAAWDCMCHGKAEFHASDALNALDAAYARGENDEFVKPTVIHAPNAAPTTISDGDVVVYMNFRADRARALSQVFAQPDFNGFPRDPWPKLAAFVMLTEYAAGLPGLIAYTPENLSNGLGEYLSKLGKQQLRIAETEKYAHVTFFFSGGREAEYPGETRVLIPSPKVETYDLKPEMSAIEVTDRLVAAIKAREFDAVICNFANGDMVGHTGVLAAAVKAVQVLDACLGRILAALHEVNGNCLITADHGNVEQMRDIHSGQPMTSHTNGPVPLVYVGPRDAELLPDGSLCDVAPTLLALMDLPQPAEMTGRSLVRFR
ncbi:MAG TPA: 2,3-bisphosphoglycerate-independent phosphoglycerate mutase, partial [Hyphomicrobiales bacterium]|nr:2,3-bisphosphoglycerate-independent phosphoglycerate mutase [Hyphomicrobiales bacterium]